jgi:hypothetical protein
MFAYIFSRCLSPVGKRKKEERREERGERRGDEKFL